MVERLSLGFDPDAFVVAPEVERDLFLLDFAALDAVFAAFLALGLGAFFTPGETMADPAGSSGRDGPPSDSVPRQGEALRFKIVSC